MFRHILRDTITELSLIFKTFSIFYQVTNNFFAYTACTGTQCATCNADSTQCITCNAGYYIDDDDVNTCVGKNTFYYIR